MNTGPLAVRRDAVRPGPDQAVDSRSAASEKNARAAGDSGPSCRWTSATVRRPLTLAGELSVRPPRGKAPLYVHAVQADGHEVWTSPLFFTSAR